jgi:hypothetical protein
MRVEPVTVVVSALVAGATAGISATAAEAVSDAYKGLKSLVLRCFRRGGVSEEAGQELISRAAEGEADRQALEQRLAEVDVDKPTVEAAQRLLDLLDEGPGKVVVDASQARGLQVGDHNTQHNTFN